jgi:hypothetical protein
VQDPRSLGFCAKAQRLRIEMLVLGLAVKSFHDGKETLWPT